MLLMSLKKFIKRKERRGKNNDSSRLVASELN